MLFTGLVERKKTIPRGMVGSEVMVTEPQAHIEKHISFLDTFQCGERLRMELMKKATQGELKAILELCLNMNEGNLSFTQKKIIPFCCFHPCYQRYTIKKK